MAEFLRELFLNMASREPPYKDALNWLQFAYNGDTQGGYRAPAKTAFLFVSPVEGGALFLPDLERLWILYLGAYAHGATSTTPLGPEGGGLELGESTHTGSAGVELFRGEVTSPP